MHCHCELPVGTLLSLGMWVARCGGEVFDPMLLTVDRARTGSELAFGVLRTLMASYSLWGSSSGLEPSQLLSVLRTAEPALAAVLDYLSGEGLILTDPDSGKVRLTDHAAQLFCQC